MTMQGVFPGRTREGWKQHRVLQVLRATRKEQENGVDRGSKSCATIPIQSRDAG